MLLPLLGGRPGQLGYLGHFKPDFFFDDLQERNIGGSQVRRRIHQRPAQGARARVKLAYPTGDQINQNVGIANFLQCLSSQFRVQMCPG